LRWTCGACGFCARGRENLCLSARFTGYHEDGGFADYAVVDERFAYVLPDAFDNLRAAPLLCAGIIGYRAMGRAAIPAGGRLALYGFGSSAHIVVQLALHRGCEVYVVTRGQSHREFARRLGAQWVGEDGRQMPSKVHSAIVFAPAGELVPVALESLDRGGTVALAGIHMTQVPPLDYEKHLFYERTVQSVTCNTRADGAALFAEAAAAGVQPRSTAYPLASANEALADLKADRIDGTGVLVTDEAASGRFCG
jgi:alcohol dehydrogenase, propanol-preferring